LSRLGTNYIDILNLHWPERYVPLFGENKFDYKSASETYQKQQSNYNSIYSQIETLNELIKQGKIRHYGLCNESPYGVTKFCTIAEMSNLAKPISIMNPYNLLERSDCEVAMQEVCYEHNENIGFFAYSPLAGGALSGKYLNAKEPLENSRLHKYVGFTTRYISPSAEAATRHYANIAKDLDVPLSVLSLAFVYSRPHVTSTIIGVTNIDQLRDNVMSLNLPIPRDLEISIDNAYYRHLMPTKGLCEIVDPYDEGDIYDESTYSPASKLEDEIYDEEQLARF
jgi:aryl-alcohol dehydrogenase (NADP+)